MDSSARLKQNLDEVQERIAAAAQRSGRRAAEITLIGVTKYVSDALTRQLFDFGCHDLGESRPQSLWGKAEDIPGARWHLIGHLQRNKVRRTLPYLALLQSLDSIALAQGVSTEAVAIGRRIPALLEVKIAADVTKHGFPPVEVRAAMETIAALPGIELRGLMTMASLEGGVDAARRDFAALRQLRDALLPDCPAGVSLNELSMGMSGDYEIAIEEGATMIRVGSALFEGLA
ncbi:MAG: YggS family pyridoxal phosphate-dependent enzyme [Planctomycetia bacterium]|nr:YggS family pyridoxal phosphate-dependent enzyme [Planctomycetia bacterium]